MVVCRGPTCGERRNSAALHQQLEDLVAERGLGAQVTLGWETCFGHCLRGPNILVYDTDEVRDWHASVNAPSAVLYNRVTPGELESILERHLAGGMRVRVWR